MKYIFGLFCVLQSFMLDAQINITYGKNRVQYRDLDWVMYESPNFTAYWDHKDNNLGKFVLQVAEAELPGISKKMEYRTGEKISIIIYGDLKRFQQSNIGASFSNMGPGDVFSGKSGTTTLIDNKLFVYFNGNHNDLKYQIKKGIAKVYLNNMLSGENIQELLQSAITNEMPAWFVNGALSYLANEWTQEQDARLRNYFASTPPLFFEDILKKDPDLVGQSMWWFFHISYGKTAVSNILYLMRLNKSLESILLYGLGITEYQLNLAWYEYFKNRYLIEKNTLAPSDIKKEALIPIESKRADAVYSQAKLSPNGKQLLYVQNEIGLVKVFLMDVATNKKELILKYGGRNTIQEPDYQYPVLSWTPNGQAAYVFYEVADRSRALVYQLSTKKTETYFFQNVDRVLSAYPLDNKKFVLTASANGLSGIYQWGATSGLKPITKDFYDYRQASVATMVGNKKLILFSSNRNNVKWKPIKFDSIMPVGQFDIYALPWHDGAVDTADIYRITNTPHADEIYPMPWDSTSFSFISDANGSRNQFIANLDTSITHYLNRYYLTNKDSITIPSDSILTLPKNQIDSVKTLPVILIKGRAWPISNYLTEINEQHTWQNETPTTLLVKEGGLSYVVKIPKNHKQITPIRNTAFKTQAIEIEKADEKSATKPKEIILTRPNETIKEIQFSTDTPKTTLNTNIVVNKTADSTKIDIDNYEFQTEFDEVVAKKQDTTSQKQLKPNFVPPALVNQPQPTPDVSEQIDVYGVDVRTQPIVFNSSSTEPLQNSKKFKYSKAYIFPYITKFKFNELTAQVDMDQLFGGLDATPSRPTFGTKYQAEPLGQVGGSYSQPFFAHFKASVEDIMNDHRLEGGVRIPISFSGYEFYLTYKDLKKRIDKYYSVFHSRTSHDFAFRATDFAEKEPFKVATITNLAQAEFRYPFNVFSSLRTIIQLRDDKAVPYPDDAQRFSALSQEQKQRLSLRFEYVLDNSVNYNLNLYRGTRIKIFANIFNRFSVSLADKFAFKPYEAFTGIVGADLRHYIPLDKKSILALRGASAVSFGSERIRYNLGGTENWLLPQNNSGLYNESVDQYTYAYNQIAANVRGFKLNSRSGSAYALANAELRIPIFHYTHNIANASNFVKNFQIVAFADAGLAWQGLNPFDKSNLSYSSVTKYGPENDENIIVTTYYQVDPVIYGLGLGLRSTILGYFVRLDYAVGYDSGAFQKPILHFSLGTDF